MIFCKFQRFGIIGVVLLTYNKSWSHYSSFPKQNKSVEKFLKISNSKDSAEFWSTQRNKKQHTIVVEN